MRYFLTKRVLRLLGPVSAIELQKTDKSIQSGTTVTLGEPVEFCYEGDVHNAYPVEEFPGMYILEGDTDTSYWLCAGEEVASKSVH